MAQSATSQISESVVENCYQKVPSSHLVDSTWGSYFHNPSEYATHGQQGPLAAERQDASRVCINSSRLHALVWRNIDLQTVELTDKSWVLTTP